MPYHTLPAGSWEVATAAQPPERVAGGTDLYSVARWDFTSSQHSQDLSLLFIAPLRKVQPQQWKTLCQEVKYVYDPGGMGENSNSFLILSSYLKIHPCCGEAMPLIHFLNVASVYQPLIQRRWTRWSLKDLLVTTACDIVNSRCFLLKVYMPVFSSEKWTFQDYWETWVISTKQFLEYSPRTWTIRDISSIIITRCSIASVWSMNYIVCLWHVCSSAPMIWRWLCRR